MKYPTDADIARADMYEDGAINLREYREACVHTKPGACDESYGGGSVKKGVLIEGAPAGHTPTIYPPGPGHRLIVRLGGKTYKRVSHKRCAGTGWDEVYDRPCGKCTPLQDGTRGTILVPITKR